MTSVLESPANKVVCLSKMHHISKNWECVFDFQYKVTIGECEILDGGATRLKGL